MLSVDVELGSAVVERGLVEYPRPLDALVVGEVRPHVVVGRRRLLPAPRELDEHEQRVTGNRTTEAHTRLHESSLGGRAHPAGQSIRFDERLLASVLLRLDGASRLRSTLSTAARNLVPTLGGGGVAGGRPGLDLRPNIVTSTIVADNYFRIIAYSFDYVKRMGLGTAFVFRKCGFETIDTIPYLCYHYYDYLWAVHDF